MQTKSWIPLTDAFDASYPESMGPLHTAEPTTWEVTIPPFGARQSMTVRAIVYAAHRCPEHRFRALTPQLKTLPEEGWPANVTLAVGPLRTQAEADEAIPALLAVKAARREVVFAPTEAIDLDPAHCQHCFHRGNEEPGEADDGTPWCMNCDSEMGFGWFFGGVPEPDVVRVRGGAPEHIASLREQCEAAGVEFVEESA